MPRKTAIHLGIALLFAPAVAAAQSPAAADPDQAAAFARRGAGVRVGIWKTQTLAVEDARYANSPMFEVYFQRGLDKRVGLESSAGVWRRTSTVPQPTGSPVTTKSYIIPIVSSLKVYPFTTHDVLLEPYLLGGAGFAIGFENVGTNAIGGGGKSTAAGFGFKAALGVEMHVTHSFGLSVAWRYQTVKFGDRVGGQTAYSGAGFEAGLTYHPRE